MKSLRFIALFILLTSCAKSPGKLDSLEIKKSVKEWINRKLIFPDSLLQLKNDTLSSVKTERFKTRNLKIVTFISGECYSCVKTLNLWANLIDSLDRFDKIEFIPIILTFDTDQFINDFYTDSPKTLELYIDQDLKFVTNYTLPNDFTLRTFLLNADNIVLLIGNPLYKNEVLKLYLEEIKSHENF